MDEETLGGGEMHTSVSGVADHLALNDAHGIQLAREAVMDLGKASPEPLKTVSAILRQASLADWVNRGKSSDRQCTQSQISMPLYPPTRRRALI